MNILESKIKLIKILLNALKSKPRRWTELMRYGLVEGDSHIGKTRDILGFLAHHGFLKLPERKRGTYKITKKGRQFLKAIESFFNAN